MNYYSKRHETKYQKTGQHIIASAKGKRIVECPRQQKGKEYGQKISEWSSIAR